MEKRFFIKQIDFVEFFGFFLSRFCDLKTGIDFYRTTEIDSCEKPFKGITKMYTKRLLSNTISLFLNCCFAARCVISVIFVCISNLLSESGPSS